MYICACTCVCVTCQRAIFFNMRSSQRKYKPANGMPKSHGYQGEHLLKSRMAIDK